MIDYQTSYSQGPAGVIPPPASYAVRWTGFITLPAGSWQVGGVTTGGMRVYLNGSSTATYDNWSGSTHSLAFGGTTLAGGRQYAIEVDAWDRNSANSIVQFAVNNVTNSAKPVPTVVPSTWLTPTRTGLPQGWTLGEDAPQWVGLTDTGAETVLNAAGGGTATFTRNSDGTFTPPAGDTDSLTMVNNILQLATASGELYAFTNTGAVASITTIGDDLHPTALHYTYGPASAAVGAPTVLQSITDPVSNRSITLSYGTASACANTNALSLLCGINYWDGTSASFLYNSNGQLAEVINPGATGGGNTSLFGYDSSNRIDDIRDALANNYLAAGQPGSSACSATVDTTCPFDTVISYDSNGRVHQVQQPTPTSGAARPSRTYTYLPSSQTPGAGSTQVSIAGFNPPGHGSVPAGVASITSYDAQSRIVSQTSSTGLSSTTVWDTDDRPVIAVSPDGEQTSSVYDLNSDVTDTYGPAPVACFDAATIPSGVTISAPVVGYLPRSDAATTGGCHTAVPHTHNTYDANMPGLADTYWPNGQTAGAPTLHGTGSSSTANAPCPSNLGNTPATSGNSLCGDWPAGTTPTAPNGTNPVGTDSNHLWSTTMTGIMTLPSPVLSC